MVVHCAFFPLMVHFQKASFLCRRKSMQCSHRKKDFFFPAVYYYNLMQSGRITLSLLVILSLSIAPAGLREWGEGEGLHLPWNSASFTWMPTQSNWVPILHSAFITTLQHEVPDTKAPHEKIFIHMIPSRTLPLVYFGSSILILPLLLSTYQILFCSFRALRWRILWY